MPKSNNFRISLGVVLSFFLALLFLASFWSYISLTKTELHEFAIMDIYTLSFKFIGFISTYTLIAYVAILKVGIEKIGKISIKDLGWSSRNLRTDIIWGLVGGLIASFAIYAFGMLMHVWDTELFLSRLFKISTSQRVVFLLIGLNAAFIEESLFRGYLQPAAIRKFGFTFGIIFTSLVFAAYHLKFTLLAFTGKFVLGLVFGLLRGRDHSLVRPALAHLLLWLVIGSM